MKLNIQVGNYTVSRECFVLNKHFPFLPSPVRISEYFNSRKIQVLWQYCSRAVDRADILRENSNILLSWLMLLATMQCYVAVEF